MADLRKKGDSKAEDNASTPLLHQHVRKEQQSSAKSESLEACRDVVRNIASLIEDDVESGLGSESSLEASLDSVKSHHLSSDSFRKRLITSLDSTGSSDLQKDEEQLQTQVIPPPPRPLSKQDDLIKGFSNIGFEDLEESMDTDQEPYGCVPAGAAKEPPIPPREPGVPNDAGNEPEPPEEEIEQEERLNLRPVRVRTVPRVPDRSFKYFSLGVFCIAGFLVSVISGILLGLEEFQEWTVKTTTVTAIFGLAGALFFCLKAAFQAKQDQAERLAGGEFIRYEAVPETVPETAETVPETAETVPETAETVPETAETVPQNPALFSGSTSSRRSET